MWPPRPPPHSSDWPQGCCRAKCSSRDGWLTSHLQGGCHKGLCPSSWGKQIPPPPKLSEEGGSRRRQTWLRWRGQPWPWHALSLSHGYPVGDQGQELLLGSFRSRCASGPWELSGRQPLPPSVQEPSIQPTAQLMGKHRCCGLHRCLTWPWLAEGAAPGVPRGQGRGPWGKGNRVSGCP